MFKLTACLVGLMGAGCQGQVAPWTETYVPYVDSSLVVRAEDFPYLLDDPKRQHLFILQPDSQIPTPVYVFAHGNGGKASDGGFGPVAQAGYTVVSWESVTAIKSPEDTQQCIADLALVMIWIKNNAATYNLDTNSIIMGGRSRGSVCSWATAQGNNPAIKGIYMYNALPSATGIDGLVSLVTKDGPPCYFAYGPECPKPIEQDCLPSPNPNDIHNPKHGQKVVDAYAALGLGSQITLTDGLTNAGTSSVFQYFSVFVASLDASSANPTSATFSTAAPSAAPTVFDPSATESPTEATLTSLAPLSAPSMAVVSIATLVTAAIFV